MKWGKYVEGLKKAHKMPVHHNLPIQGSAGYLVQRFCLGS